MDVNGPPNRASSTPRPRRGMPHETRSRLVAAAAALFNRVGFHGTDSNRIAHAAGYSTGVFYKHFKDKREIFLAAYEEWSIAEWKKVATIMSSGGSDREIARQLVLMFIDMHTEWRGLLASLRQLVFTDATVRRFHRRQRRRQLVFADATVRRFHRRQRKRQLDWMAELRAQRNASSKRRSQQP